MCAPFCFNESFMSLLACRLTEAEQNIVEWKNKWREFKPFRSVLFCFCLFAPCCWCFGDQYFHASVSSCQRCWGFCDSCKTWSEKLDRPLSGMCVCSVDVHIIVTVICTECQIKSKNQFQNYNPKTSSNCFLLIW